MALVRLAWSNVSKRLSRSIITLFAMGIAAAVMTSGMSISQGMTKSAYSEFRHYFEGDIVMFTPGFIGASPVKQTADLVVRRVLLDSGFNPILQVFPQLDSKGYLADSNWSYRPFGPDIVAQVKEMNGISSAHGFLCMPGLISGKPYSLRPEPDGLANYISEGRTARNLDNRLEVVLNAYGTLQARVGDTITIAVPEYKVDAHGIPFTDMTLPPANYEAQVVGLVSWPSRAMHWPDATGIMTTETGYIHANEVYLTEHGWHSIWHAQSQSEAYNALSLRLRVHNMSEAGMVARRLRNDFPEYVVLDMPELVERGLRYGLLDKFYLAPTWMWQGEALPNHPLAQEDFSSVTVTLLFINAGMLMSSQMLAAVSSRRQEIGVLKAIGARRHEITMMILIEAVMLAVIGAASGFVLVRLAAIHQALTNGAPLLKITADTAREAGFVLALTMACSLLFGAMPAWSISQLSVMEVLRRE